MAKWKDGPKFYAGSSKSNPWVQDLLWIKYIEQESGVYKINHNEVPLHMKSTEQARLDAIEQKKNFVKEAPKFFPSNINSKEGAAIQYSDTLDAQEQVKILQDQLARERLTRSNWEKLAREEAMARVDAEARAEALGIILQPQNGADNQYGQGTGRTYANTQISTGRNTGRSWLGHSQSPSSLQGAGRQMSSSSGVKLGDLNLSASAERLGISRRSGKSLQAGRSSARRKGENGGQWSRSGQVTGRSGLATGGAIGLSLQGTSKPVKY